MESARAALFRDAVGGCAVTLTLRVISAHGPALGPEAVREFGLAGGTIGRAQSNDWVLPDPERFISSHHAEIERRGDGYYIVDRSINGTYVNQAEQPVGHGNAQLLADGDRIRIGEYEIVANVVFTIYTNYFNNVAQTEIDFPHAPSVREVAAVA